MPGTKSLLLISNRFIHTHILLTEYPDIFHTQNSCLMHASYIQYEIKYMVNSELFKNRNENNSKLHREPISTHLLCDIGTPRGQMNYSAREIHSLYLSP